MLGAGGQSSGGSAGTTSANGGATGTTGGVSSNGGKSSGGAPSGGTSGNAGSAGTSGKGGGAGTSAGGASGGVGGASGGTSAGGSASGGAGGGTGNECPEGSTGANCSTCVVYVNQAGGSDTSDGKTWAGAKASLQAGIDAAATAPTCHVWVAKGSYVPTYKADPFAAANTATLLMRPGVALFGGFAGGERALEARNVASNVTTVTGEIGTSANTDNLRRVVTWADKAVLDGFTVTRSYGAAIGCEGGSLTIKNSTITGNVGGYGGGMWLTNGCAATVTNSTFSSNVASLSSSNNRGGGIYAESNGSLIVEDCTFTSNSSTSGNGGAILSFSPTQIRNSLFENNNASTGGAVDLGAGATNTVENCTFRGNKASGGAAIWANGTLVVRGSTFTNNAGATSGAVQAASATIEDSTFSGNSAINVNGATSAVGGGLRASGTVKLKRVSFSSNSVSAGNTSSGGAFFCGSGCAATLVDVSFHANTAFGLGATSTYGSGGAIFFDGTSLSLSDCQFTLNRTRVNGGAIANGALSSSTLVVTNSTFYGNAAESGSGGAIYNYSGPSTFLNSIFWGNTAFVQGNQVFNNGGATSTVRACDVQGSGFNGTNGNIDQDPLFVSTATGSLDLRLGTGSPCIDHGANADLPVDALDLDGDGNLTEPLPLDIDGLARVQNVTVDIGAHEKQ